MPRKRRHEVVMRVFDEADGRSVPGVTVTVVAVGRDGDEAFRRAEEAYRWLLPGPFVFLKKSATVKPRGR